MHSLEVRKSLGKPFPKIFTLEDVKLALGANPRMPKPAIVLGAPAIYDLASSIIKSGKQKSGFGDLGEAARLSLVGGAWTSFRSSKTGKSAVAAAGSIPPLNQAIKACLCNVLADIMRQHPTDLAPARGDSPLENLFKDVL